MIGSSGLLWLKERGGEGGLGGEEAVYTPCKIIIPGGLRPVRHEQAGHLSHLRTWDDFVGWLWVVRHKVQRKQDISPCLSRLEDVIGGGTSKIL